MIKRFIHLAISLLLFPLASANAQGNSKIILKVKEEFRTQCKSNTIQHPLFLEIGKNNTLQKKFPKHQALLKKSKQEIDLSLIYELELNSAAEVAKIIKRLKNTGILEYAEPVPQVEVCFTPNDTLLPQQYYLQAVKALEGWDIQKGDSSLVIAIVDTGTDLDHPDLVNQLALNADDPINGLDDDNDGYVDNYYGWNTASNNNNVSFENSGHGTNVAGLASAETDNTFGMSGLGFKTKFLTVRIDLPNGFLSNAYAGLVYAADQGADIINASWGSNGYSQYAQDIVHYVTYNKGALIVAGAGNFGNEVPFYPAAYEEVIAVGSLIEGDTVKSQSNYGTWLQLFAPGDNMLTTNVIGGFGVNGGTSMASPLVAACAALVKAQYPNYNVQQIAQQLYSTADRVDALSPIEYAGKMGFGKVNLFRALTESNAIGIDLVNLSAKNELGSQFAAGDTLQIEAQLINYLSPATQVKVKLNPQNSKYTLLNAEVNAGNLNSLDTFVLQNSSISFIVNSGLSPNELIELEFEITATAYSRKKYTRIFVNKDFITLTENELTATYTSSGGVGYSGPFANLGEGISFLQGNSFLYEGGLVVGNSDSYVVDKFRNEQNGVDQDFQIINNIEILSPKKANVELGARFTDGNAPNPQGLEIKQKNYLFRGGNGSRSIIYVYTLTNNGFIPLNNLHGGLFMDWDINDYTKNKIEYDSARRMGISYATDTNLFAGLKILSEDMTHHHFALDNLPFEIPEVNPSNGLSEAEKFYLLSHSRDSAGVDSTGGNDIIDIVSVGPFDLKVDSSISISFLISLSDNLDSLRKQADSLQETFNRLSLDLIEQQTRQTQRVKSQIYPNPSNDFINIEFYLPQAEVIRLEISDAMGKAQVNVEKKLYPSGNNLIRLPIFNLKSGVYFLGLIGNNLKIENTFVKSSK